MEVSLARVNLCRLAEEVVRSSKPLVRDSPVMLEAILPEQPIELVTDAAKVRQVLVNLISNAIKFTNEGRVAVEVTQDTVGVCLSVVDTGIGIKKEHLTLIFDEFRQVDGSSTRRHGGTGLGLAISKKLVELVGGSIQVNSSLGRGSTFTVTLPATPPSQEQTS